jgi:hypothetical protein
VAVALTDAAALFRRRRLRRLSSHRGSSAGQRVTVEPAGDGELRIRRTTTTFEDAFGALTGTYPTGYLEQLDAEDEVR